VGEAWLSAGALETPGGGSEALAHKCFRTSYPLSETRGFLKALVAADGDRILGFTAFGVGAAEMMSAVQIAMIAGLPYTALRDAVLTHPTLVEGLIPLFSSVASAHNGADATRTKSVGMR
jgi:hypothetical protein